MDKYTIGDIHKALSLLEGEDGYSHAHRTGEE